GSIIVDWLNGRYVYYLNIPFGLVALLLVFYYYRDNIPKTTFKLDWLGTILFTLGAALLVYGLGDSKNWMILSLWMTMILSGLVDSRHPYALLPIRSLKLKIPRLAILQNLLAGMGYFGILAFLPLYVQRVEDRGATTAGLVLTPMIVGWTLTNIIGGR